MSTVGEGSVPAVPPSPEKHGKDSLKGLRRRQFLGWLAGAAGGLRLARPALGRGFLAIPEDPEGLAALMCTRVTGTSTCTTVITTPSTSWSTSFTVSPGEPFTRTGVVYTTTSGSGTLTSTITVVEGTNTR